MIAGEGCLGPVLHLTKTVSRSCAVRYVHQCKPKKRVVQGQGECLCKWQGRAGLLDGYKYSNLGIKRSCVGGGLETQCLHKFCSQDHHPWFLFEALFKTFENLFLQHGNSDLSE